MLNCLLVGAGGFAGAVLRYLLSLVPVPEPAGFPLVTLFINVIGALVIGVLAGLAGKAEGLSPELLLLLKVGVCGGFTTFSTFALETTNLFSGGKAGVGVLYILLSVGLCLLAVLLGKALVRA